MKNTAPAAPPELKVMTFGPELKVMTVGSGWRPVEGKIEAEARYSARMPSARTPQVFLERFHWTVTCKLNIAKFETTSTGIKRQKRLFSKQRKKETNKERVRDAGTKGRDPHQHGHQWKKRRCYGSAET